MTSPRPHLIPTETSSTVALSLRGRGAQLDLFSAIQDVYREAANDGSAVSNRDLYPELVKRGVLSAEEISSRSPIGQSGALHSTGARRVRWLQQTMRTMGLLERVGDRRGHWQLTPGAKQELTIAPAGVAMLAFETKYGFAIWSDCRTLFSSLSEPVHLVLTSPPYPLRKARAYGNPSEAEYVDFIVRCLEPIMKTLVDGGSVCLNISNDIFEEGSPSRSLYRERLVLALHDRLGLSKMDELIWLNKSKAPGPYQWASKRRVQLNVAWEPVYWFTNNPQAVRTDNRRVLQPHTELQKKLIASGGERRDAVYSDGAYRINPGAFGNATEGSIMRNVLEVGHRCRRNNAVREYMREHGLPTHGAPMPFALANRLVRFMTEKDDLVVDPFGGTLTTAQAAEENGRRWITSEQVLEYIQGGRSRFAAS